MSARQPDPAINFTETVANCYSTLRSVLRTFVWACERYGVPVGVVDDAIATACLTIAAEARARRYPATVDGDAVDLFRDALSVRRAAIARGERP